MRPFAANAGDASLEVEGERLWLMPERTVYWPAREILLVADLHWGKAASFRASGVAIPSGTLRADLKRLSQALTRTAARRLIVLGDLIHARKGRATDVFNAVGDWRDRFDAIEIIVVRGNHDRHAGDPDPAWRMGVVDEPWRETPFLLRHHPIEDDAGYSLAGHVHPAVVLRDSAGDTLRLPCFYFGSRYAILPAAGGFTGTAPVRPQRRDRVFVIAEEEVIQVL